MVISALAGAVALMLTIAGWSRRHEVFGARTFVIAGSAACTWCWAIVAFEWLDAPGDYPYSAVAVWLAAVSTFVASLYVMARRAVRPRWSPPRWAVAVFVAEALTILVLEATNHWHHLMGTRTGGELDPGIAYQVHTAYCIGLMLAAAATLSARQGLASVSQRRQILILQVLVVAVAVVEISQLGITQYIAVTGLAVLYRSMFSEGLNELVPVPRGAAIEQMDDYVFFFDGAGRLVDMNSSARRAMETLEQQAPRVGATVADVFGVELSLVETTDTFVVLGEGVDAVETVARCSSLTDGHGAIVGWIVIARDLSTVAPRIGPMEGSGVDELMRRRGDRPVAHDPVTGMLTRAQLDHILVRSVRHALSASEPLSVALLDVDGFKAINDTYGHLAGDAVLKEIAHRVDRAAGGAVTVGRFGGDEFVAVFVGQRIDQASGLAEAMRVAVAAEPLPVGDVVVGVTVTIGVAQHDGGSVAELIHAADAAMYRAKRAGRNQVAAAD